MSTVIFVRGIGVPEPALSRAVPRRSGALVANTAYQGAEPDWPPETRLAARLIERLRRRP